MGLFPERVVGKHRQIFSPDFFAKYPGIDDFHQDG